MKVRRFLATLVMVSLLATVLGACGSKTEDTGEGNYRATATVTPTPTPTPTEVPKSPEALDVEAITRLFDAAARAVEDPESKLTEGTRFLLTFEEDHIKTELDADVGGFERRIWESWIQDAGLTRASYPLESERFRESCRYGSIIGVLDGDRKIHWTTDNLSDELFAALGSLGAEKSPSYLERLTLYEETKGDWHGTMSPAFGDLVDALGNESCPENKELLHTLDRFLRSYGFSGSLGITVDISIQSEKELRFSMAIDWSGLSNALHSAASNESDMTRFLCCMSNVDERTLKAYLRMEGTDVMTYGNTIVRSLDALFAEYKGVDNTCSYSTSGDEILILPVGDDKLTYNRASGTLIYTERVLSCTLKRQ